MEPTKQIFVAYENRAPHMAYRGNTPKVGEQMAGDTVLVVADHPHNPQQAIAIIGELPIRLS
jgi:hypothetical protein